METKFCNQCFSNQPAIQFGFSKYIKDGKADSCHDCRAQYYRLRRNKLYTTTQSSKDNSLIRNVNLHNSKLFESLKSDQFNTSHNILAFVPTNKDELFLVLLDFSTMNFRLSIKYAANPERIFREFIIPKDLPTLKEEVIKILKIHRIRLELSELDILNSKASIYYL